MAKSKKKRRRPSSSAATARSGQPAPGTARSGQPSPKPSNAAKRERRDAARAQREKAAKAAVRRGAIRRAAIGGVVGVVVFVAIGWYTNRAPAATALSQTAVDTAATAGCDALVSPVSDAPGGQHLPSPGAQYTYDQHPATSGEHDPIPLPGQPRIYEAADMAQFHETQAVHSLEHGSVIMYYRASGDADGLPTKVVDHLGPIAETNPATYLIPYPDLPEGTALAFTAWNKLLTCPSTITGDQATTVAQGFVDAFACTNNAPEGNRGDGC
jgi:hypothetical protein